jgi:uncharacterized membrane protein
MRARVMPGVGLLLLVDAMKNQMMSFKSVLRRVMEPESILLCLALLRFAYKFWDREGFWAYWNVLTEDAFFLLLAAATLRVNKLWSYIAAILLCGFVLYMLYRRWVGNWEFVAAHYEHYVMQIVFGVAISTCAVVCMAYKGGRNRSLP